MHKIERLMGIILSINKNKKITANELAREFEVDVRTIYRDIQALSELNIPVISGVGYDGGYSLPEDFFVPPVMFNKDEIFSLLLSRKVIYEIGIPGYTEHINSAFLKLEAAASNKLMDTFKDVEKRIKFGKKDKAFYPQDFKYFLIVKEGLEHNKKLKIKYILTESNDTEEMIIRPYGLIYVEDVWVVVSYCEPSGFMKSLEINLIMDCELAEEYFNMPNNFNIDDYYCRYHCIVKCKDEGHTMVKLRIKKSSYARIKDYIFFNHGETIEDSDYYILTIRSSNPESYVKIAFNFYDTVEILEPVWLRDKFIGELRNLNKRYIGNQI